MSVSSMYQYIIIGLIIIILALFAVVIGLIVCICRARQVESTKNEVELVTTPARAFQDEPEYDYMDEEQVRMQLERQRYVNATNQVTEQMKSADQLSDEEECSCENDLYGQS
jgi:hypothetical protein